MQNFHTQNLMKKRVSLLWTIFGMYQTSRRRYFNHISGLKAGIHCTGILITFLDRKVLVTIFNSSTVQYILHPKHIERTLKKTIKKVKNYADQSSIVEI